jgi:glutathione synthase/RimK-type ligase-like ATP-grasp enzyme
MVKAPKTTTTPAVIGTTEFIVLPENSDMPVPAKIDTGADGSSVWASEIEEHDGELSFVLFAPNSAFYTGHVLKTNKYRVTRVKNSFGVDEFRYRVWLKVEVADKRYNASFTLANRSNSRFPLLIGKRFLNKRFLVDVSRSNLVTPKDSRPNDTVVVLCTMRDDETKAFFDGVAQQGKLNIELCHYRDLSYIIDEDGIPAICLPNGSDIASASFVYFKDYQKSYMEPAATIAHYLQYRHVNFMDTEVAYAISQSKLSELFTLATEGIQVPATTWLTNGVSGSSYAELKKQYGPVFILKDAFADRGRRNVLVRSAKDFAEAERRLEKSKLVIAQQYIENDGYHRVVVMAREPVQVVYRTATLHEKDAMRDHLNNPAGSANATEVDIDKADPEMLAMAIRASIAMGRDIAGVDIIQDRQTGQWYIAEANYNPSMLKGINTERKQLALAEILRTKGNVS